MLGLSTFLAFSAALVAAMLAGHVALSRRGGNGLALFMLLLLAVQAGSLGLQLLRPGLFPTHWRALSGAALPGLLFLLFTHARRDADAWQRRDALHLLPVLMVAALVTWPGAGWRLDAALLMITLGYALGLLSGDRRDRGHPLRRQARLLAALLLLALAVVDGGIAWTLNQGGIWAEAGPLPLGALLLLLPGLLLFVWAWRDPEWWAPLHDSVAQAFAPTAPVEPAPPPAPSPGTDDAPARALCARLDALLSEQRLYTEFGLDLSRLARRLQVSPRQLSAAINRIHGRGLRTLLNDWKVEDAARQLRDPALRDKPITEVMFDAGFQTKSNFNKEFLQRKGVPPSEFRYHA